MQLNGIAQQAFDSIDGFVGITTRLYVRRGRLAFPVIIGLTNNAGLQTQHLSLVAKNTYLIPTKTEVSAVLTALRPRLVIEYVPHQPFSRFCCNMSRYRDGPAHALAFLLIIIGLTGFTVGFLHWRARRTFFLAAPPGTIASAVSLTSHSGFGNLLYPYDTMESMQHKMTGLRFGLDERTGAIQTYDQFGALTDVGGIDGAEYGTGKLGAGVGSNSLAPQRNTMVRGSTYGSEETKMSLLGNESTPRNLGLSSTGYALEPFVPPVTPPPGHEGRVASPPTVRFDEKR